MSKRRMTKQEALKLKRHDEIALKDGNGLLISHVWEEGPVVKIQGWLEDETLITVTHRELAQRSLP